MTVYGFNEESVALRLKEMALEELKGPTTPTTSNDPFPVVPSVSKKMFLAVITEDIHPAAHGGFFEMGSGKAIIFHRDKVDPSNAFSLIAQTFKDELGHIHDVERDVYNFTDQGFGKDTFVDTNPAILTKSQTLVMLIEDYLGDLYIIPQEAKPLFGIAMATDDIPAAKIDGEKKTVEPGIEKVTMLDWKRKDDGDYQVPPVNLEAKKEDDPLFDQPDPDNPIDVPQVEVERNAYNFSESGVRASVDEAVILVGTELEVVKTKMFLISNIFDYRATPGHFKGTDPKKDAQGPHHKGNEGNYQMGHGRCEAS